jgi:hypothetical protein
MCLEFSSAGTGAGAGAGAGGTHAFASKTPMQPTWHLRLREVR